MVYVLRHTSLAGVMSCIVYVLVWLLVFGGASLADLSNRILHVPALILAAGVLVFAIGGTHYLLPSLANVARGLRRSRSRP
jgi:amino acid permease